MIFGIIFYIVYYLIYMNKANWKPFYQHSLLLFQFLEEHTDNLFLEAERKSLNYAENGYGIYSTAQNSGYASQLPVAPRFMHSTAVSSLRAMVRMTMGTSGQRALAMAMASRPS